MLGSLIGGKFSNKCKYSVKCIKCRMETILKKKQAMVRCLKKDIADLISGGHDANAYGRMDALIVEINKSSCYDMIEHYCCCILEHLRTMQKDRVCPEEATEAIATLIFAAARFSDLPELIDLRHQFADRYGTHMEAYVNQEFVEKIQKKSFSKDKKLQLMQDIAQDFSVQWDVKAFEYEISNPRAPTHGQPKVHVSSNNGNNQQSLMFIGRRESPDGSKEVFHGGKPDRCRAEDSSTAHRTNDMKKQRAKSDKFMNSEPVKEEQNNTIQMDRYVHSYESAVHKKEVAAYELDSVESHQFDKRVTGNGSNGNQNGNYTKDWNCAGGTRKIPVSVREGMGRVAIATSMTSGDPKATNISPPYAKFSDDLNRTSTDDVHSTVKEIDPYRSQGCMSNQKVNAANNRPINPKPPYVKPKVTRSPTENGCIEPSNDGAVNVEVHPKNLPFSVRSKRLEQAPATVPEHTADDRQILMSPPSDRTDDDVIDRRTHRTFRELPGHGCTRYSEKREQDEEAIGNPLMYYSNRKDRARMRVPSELPTLVKPTCTVETTIRRPVRVSSLQQDQLSSYVERMPSKLPDHDDLVARLASLKKL